MRSIFKFESDAGLAKGWQQAEARDGIFEHPFGLPGTEPWWQAIALGSLPVLTVEDYVAACEPPGENPGQGSTFTLRDGSRWPALDSRGRFTSYFRGQLVRIRYVALSSRKSGAGIHKFPLEIEVDNS